MRRDRRGRFRSWRRRSNTDSVPLGPCVALIQLDDVPNETLTYTISDAADPDVEAELPAARVSELSTGATGQK